MGGVCVLDDSLPNNRPSMNSLFKQSFRGSIGDYQVEKVIEHLQKGAKAEDFMLDTRLVALKLHHAQWIRKAAECLTGENVNDAWRQSGIVSALEKSFCEVIVARGEGAPVACVGL